jgi:hypothetical protein
LRRAEGVIGLSLFFTVHVRPPKPIASSQMISACNALIFVVFFHGFNCKDGKHGK